MTLEELGRQKYISLTTFKRDGSAVATPVWVVSDAEHLYAITDPTSGKAKRLRNSSRARIAPCDMRGTVTGPAVDAVVVLLDGAGTKRVEALINGKYALMARMFALAGVVGRLVGRGAPARVGLQIDPEDGDDRGGDGGGRSR